MYIDPDLVINPETFKLIEQNVICPICSGVLISPIQCLGCENCFCQACIEDWKKRQGGNDCPFKCNNPTFKNSRMIKNILSNVKFKCKNGCKQEIPYLELENHYKEKCRNNKTDYKQKYFEYKNKYLDLLKKNIELELFVVFSALDDKKTTWMFLAFLLSLRGAYPLLVYFIFIIYMFSI